MDPLSVAASVAGLLGLAIQVSQMVYEQVHTSKNATKDAATLLEELDSLSQVLTKLKQFLADRASNGRPFNEASVFIKAITGCNAQISALKNRLDKLIRKQGVAQMIERGKWYYEHDEHQQLIQTLHRYIGVFQIALSVDGIELISKAVDDVAQDIKSLKSAISALTIDSQEAEAKSKQLDDILDIVLPLSTMSGSISDVTKTVQRWDLKWQNDESREILEWLSPLNIWQKQLDMLSRREVDTGQWILEDPAFNEWLDGSQRILWCPGMPGAGKTILTSVVIDYLQNEYPQDDTCLAFIYCNYKEQEEQGKQTLVNLIASLLQQVLWKRPLPTGLLDLYKKHINMNTRPTVAECLELLHAALSSHSRAFFVVDALDECEDNNGTRDTLLRILLELPTTTSLMVTSRHVQSIELQLDQSRRLEIRASDKDICVYLERQIQRKTRLEKHAKKDPSLKQAILEGVVKAAQGMFLLAQLYIDALSQKHTPKAVRTSLQSLPESLDGTYDEAMDRIRSQNKEDAELAHRVLSWISFALRPLTVAEMRHAISVVPGQTSMDEDDLIDEEIVVSVCAGLVVIDQESEVMRLIHYTTQDYFDRNRQAHFSDGQVNITMSCLIYLSFEDFWCGSSDLWELEAEQQRYPLFMYAAQNWGLHARGGAESILQSQILTFLARKSNWITILRAMLPDEDRRFTYMEENAAFSGLWLAAGFGLAATVKTLLKGNVKLNRKIVDEETALHEAAKKGHQAVVQILLDRGGDIEAKDYRRRTPLHLAASVGQQATVQMLLDRGANIDAQDCNGRAPLQEAADKGRQAIVQILLDRGADIDAKDCYGRTALLEASFWQPAITQMLLDKQADIKVMDNSGNTPLHDASIGGRPAIVQMLLDNGADIDAKDKYGRTPLHKAAGIGQQATPQSLLDMRRADIKVLDNFWNTLYDTGTGGRQAIVQMLLDNGADIGAKDENGTTALHEAASANKIAVVEVLLENGAEIEVKDNKGRTAADLAAMDDDNKRIVQLLLENGADAKAKDRQGTTAANLEILGT